MDLKLIAPLKRLNLIVENITFTVEKSTNSHPFSNTEITLIKRRQFVIISLEKTYTHWSSFKLSSNLSFKMEIWINYLPPELRQSYMLYRITLPFSS